MGFVPGVTDNGHLMGIFQVDVAHNIVHLASGAAALLAAWAGRRAARAYFLGFGVLYGLVALLGFAYGNAPILGILANNAADSWLHVMIAATALAIGVVEMETSAGASDKGFEAWTRR